VIVSIIWLIFEPGFRSSVAVLTTLVVFIGLLIGSNTPTISLTSEKTKSTREERNRGRMLELVKNSWVKDVLERSLNDEVLIELGLEEQGDAVLNRQGIELQTPGKPNRLLPPGTKVVDVFDEMGQTLLILGEPGSGKTTTLLELARDTIDRAEEDPIQEIPVVFNLSSWTDPKKPIADWLVDELNTNYDIQRKVASEWIEHNDLLLLLDGLDEVLPERREACAAAINDFRSSDPGRAPLVICCRSEEYEALTDRLDLEGAVCLQPLTAGRVDDYLDRIGQELAALRAALKDDPTLYELAQSPLMLSIMTLAYRGMSVHDLQPLETVDTRRKHIFDNYVEHMFKPRTHRTIPDVSNDPRLDDERFSKEETIHWLSWLAKRMSQHGQTVFLIERMQPDWLPTRAQRWIMAGGVAVMIGLLFGMLFGALIGLATGLQELFVGVFVGVLFGIPLGLFHVLFSYDGDIKPVETLHFSWKAMILTAVGIGLLAWLSIWLCIPGSDSFRTPPMFVGLLFFGLIGAVFAGLSKGEMVTTASPNEGIRRSARNALYIWLLFASFFGLFSVLIVGVLPGEIWLPGLVVVFLLGSSLGLVTIGLDSGLDYGGLACIQHLVLRIMLWRNGSAPLNYVRFLDCAADRIFLRKVGGGYIFVHRLLLEYFASLEPEEEGG